jgi:hypothetical protein
MKILVGSRRVLLDLFFIFNTNAISSPCMGGTFSSQIEDHFTICVKTSDDITSQNRKSEIKSQMERADHRLRMMNLDR